MDKKSVIQIRSKKYYLLILIIKPFHLCAVTKEYLFHINVVISLRLGVVVIVLVVLAELQGAERVFLFLFVSV